MLQARPIFTDLPIRGLRAPMTILQVTDLHAAAMTEEEIATMSEERLTYARGRVEHFSTTVDGQTYPAADAFPVMAAYADEIEADLTLLTGDILDFPSEANFALLERFIDDSPRPVLTITGNHDWSFADDYRTPQAEAAYLSRLSRLSGSIDHAVVYDTDEVTFIAIDNGGGCIPADAVEVYVDALRDARAAGRAVILCMHVPLRADTLTHDCSRVWGRDICIGVGATGEDDETTVSFFRAVTEESELAPDALITGHLHFAHEDVFPNGVPQFITPVAANGTCRVIRLIPAE